MKIGNKFILSSSLIAATSFVLLACAGADKTPAQGNSGSQADTPQHEAALPTVWRGTAEIKPLYPDQAESANLQLDYETYQFAGNGMSVTPLPPHLDRSVELQLGVRPAGYKVTSGGPECSYELEVTIGSGAPKSLDPKRGEVLEIAGAEFAGADHVRLMLALEDRAENNWSCGILIEPAL